MHAERGTGVGEREGGRKGLRERRQRGETEKDIIGCVFNTKQPNLFLLLLFSFLQVIDVIFCKITSVITYDINLSPHFD